jgi:hypothetical protein
MLPGLSSRPWQKRQELAPSKEYRAFPIASEALACEKTAGDRPKVTKKVNLDMSFDDFIIAY